MSIARVQFATNSTSVSGNTVSVTLGATPTAGNILVAAVAFFGSASQPGSACAFSSTNVVWMNTQPAAQGGSSTSLGLGIGRVRSGGSTTVTATIDQAGGLAFIVAEYSGLSQNFDKFVSAVGSSTSPASGATATTGTANQLWIGAISARATSGNTFSSPTNSFAIVGQAKSTLGTTSDRSICLLERIVTATGTPNAGATISPTGAWIAECLTIEELVATSAMGSLVDSNLLVA